MKRTTLLATLVAVITLTGCAGRQFSVPTQDECTETAERYTALMDALNAGNVVSDDDLERGRRWAEILRVSCGWLPTRGELQGVPVVRPPWAGAAAEPPRG